MYSISPCGAGRKRADGFTLVELMVVCAIVAILAAIAYPAYTGYAQRAKRADAMNALVQDAQALQRCYSQNFTYAVNCNIVAGTVATANNDYNITVTIPAAAIPAPSYSITATPINGQASDTTCSTFLLLSNGQQTAQDGGGADQTATCWGTK